MLLLIKIFLLILSFSGYCMLLKQLDKKIKIEYMPIIVFSGIGNILILAAYIGVLKQASFVIYVSGLLLVIVLAVKTRLSVFSIYDLLFWAVAAFTGWKLKDVIYADNDSFSHYGIMLKTMLRIDGLPDSLDTLIQFKSYPAGMSCFQYYVSMFTEQIPGMACLAQLLLQIAAFYVIFGAVKNKRIISFAVLCLVGYRLLIYQNFIDGLMLDTAIALIGAAALLMLIENSKEAYNKYIYVGVILSFGFLTKNSFLCYVVLAAGYVVLTNIRNGAVKKLIFTVGLPVVQYILWMLHVKTKFTDGLVSNHAMTIENYTATFDQRNGQELLGIIKAWIKKNLVLEKPASVIMLCLTVLLISLLFAKTKKDFYRESKFFNIIYICIAEHIIWMVGLLLMYMFSMRDSMANELESFERYRASSEIFIWYFVLTMLIFLLEDIKKIFDRKWTIIICLIALCPMLSQKAPIIYHSDEAYIRWLEEIKKEYDIEEESSYIIYYERELKPEDYTNDMLKERHMYETQYVLYSDRYVFADRSTIEGYIQSKKYRYVLMYIQDDYGMNMIKGYNDGNTAGVIKLY